MCGIVGATTQRNVAAILLEGLKRLEYRGYDSAGMAVINAEQHIDRVRQVGKVSVLENSLSHNPIAGHIGIAHTRWATHGKPSEINSHPHLSGALAIVHNGVIENYSELRQELSASGYEFSSETDTEVIIHLLHQQLKSTSRLVDAVKNSLSKLSGAFAIAVINAKEPDTLVAACQGSPIVIGVGIDEHFVASDAHALLPVTQRFIYLEEGDIAEITPTSVGISNAQGKAIAREIQHAHDLGLKNIEHLDEFDKGKYRHFMLKEIFEQDTAISNTLEGRLLSGRVSLEDTHGDIDKLAKDIENIHIVACGTSYHAGLVARYWFEGIVGLPCHVEIASEYRYRRTVVPDNTLFICISQSGETADTLAALRKAKHEHYTATLAICNVNNSSLMREADMTMLTRAGKEIGVASTKAFTTQLTSLLILVCAFCQARKLAEAHKAIIEQLRALPGNVHKTLGVCDDIETLCKQFADKHHTLFLGRGHEYPIALEGALKLKEISYIHAEAFPAGELKHGPLALVDKDIPVVAIAPNNELLEKLKSNIEEVVARGGKLFVFSSSDTSIETHPGMQTITLPLTQKEIGEYTAPILYTVPMQLLAYHVAVIKGTDVDQPRNLAKSVTVE